MKAALAPDPTGVYPALTPAFWADISEQLDRIGDLRRTSLGGDGAAKADGDGAEDAEWSDAFARLVARTDEVLGRTQTRSTE